MKKLLIAFVLSFFAMSVFAADFEEGIHYRELLEKQPTRTGDKVEVLELFWYACPHCYDLEEPLQRWKANIPANAEFVAIPAILRPNWEFHAKVYYAFEALGVLDQFHEAMFKAYHEQGEKHFKPEPVAMWVEKNGGPSKQEFMDVFESFAVDTGARNSHVLGQRYDISGVPSVVVGGKYLTSPVMAGNHDKLFQVVDFLIKKVRSESDS